MYPQVFGWQHLTFLAIFISIATVSLICIKKYIKNKNIQDAIVRFSGAILFLFIVWNRISIAVCDKNPWFLIPDTFCGMSSLVLALATMFGKRNNNVLHFVFYFSFVGGFLTMIYPTFLNQDVSFLYGMTISGMLHHAMGLYVCVLLCLVGWFSPNYKKWPNLLIGFLSYITLGTFLISALGYSDAFYIINPVLPGTPLTVWLLIPIFGVGYAIFMLIYEKIHKKLNINKIINKQDDFIKIDNNKNK